MHHTLLRCLAIALPALAPALGAQTLAWHRLANPGVPYAAAWDSARQCTVLACYDGAQSQWEWNGTSAEERLAMLQDAPGLLWLGDDPPRRQLVAVRNPTSIGTWDGARWSWHTPLSSPAIAGDARFAFDARRGRLVVYGGTGSPGDVHEWDGSTWWSTPGSSTPIARTEAAFAFDPVGQRCVLYGGTQNGSPVADCWSWDGSTWSLIAANAPPGARARAAMGFAPGLGGLLLYGGSTATTTFRLLGNTWSQVPTAHDPGPRDRALLVQDPLGMLLVGGTGDPFGVAWRFTGTDWVALATTFAAPFATTFDTVASDRTRNQTVLLGGISNQGATWVFDTRWHAMTPAHSPPPRNGPQLCWSTIEQQVLLFGGIDGMNTSLADTWSWTGTDWLQRTSTASPPPRYGAMLAEDPNGGVMLFGGFNGTTTFGDHWHWNGTQWQQRTPAVLPSPRAFCHAALDPIRNRVVTPGPLIISSLTVETWEWDGSTWTLAATTPYTTAPSRRVAFDPRLAQVVAPGATTYAWNGTTWTGMATATTALPIGVMGLVTDFARQRVLAIGSRVCSLTPTPPAATGYGFGCALGPSPALHAIDDPLPGSASFAIDVGTLASSAPTFLALGLLAQSQPLGAGCTLLVGQPVATRFAVAGPGAQARFPIPIPNDPGLRGVQFVAQGAVFDPPRSLLGSVTITAGLRITIGD